MLSTTYFVNCPKGLELLLKEELLTLGVDSVRETVAGVQVVGGSDTLYRICLWSRLANRVLLPLSKYPVNSGDDLYAGASEIRWSDHLEANASIAVDFVGVNKGIRHTQYGSQRIKDAIVDQFQRGGGVRPSVDLKAPDMRINAYLSKDQLTLSLDLSGQSLHRRGYRVAQTAAPLKENLAAALLLRAGWPDIFAAGGGLIDPMCGCGTLLIEAAMMATDYAPGLLRTQYGFLRWLGFDSGLWEAFIAEANERRDQGLAKSVLPEIRGYDKDAQAVRATEANVAAAGLDACVRVLAKPLEALKKSTHKQINPGLIITNPPYGERWGEVESLRPLYRDLGRLAKAEFPGWRLGVFTGNMDLAQELRLRADKSYSLYNGAIAAKFFLYSLHEAQALPARKGPDTTELSENVAMLVNRLKKNLRRINPWLKRSQVSCFRLYDCDIPEYAVAVDLYGDVIHVQEYAPPSSIDPQLARKRLGDMRRALLHLYPNSRDKLYFKERRRQRGASQYQSLTPWDRKSGGFVVTEGLARLEVNLSDYLDSGLFLDHRPVRELVAQWASGKRFLNLFCYTATATVHAALGGAVSSLSVDMSNTYLEWAKRNFELNGLDLVKHRLERADCFSWLEKRQGQYDLILLDPPTFSNSRKMTEVLDLQRDHRRLIEASMVLLARNGTLIFSNNFRKFILDEAIGRDFQVEDITQQTIPPDFQRTRAIHHCWIIRHRTSTEVS